VESGGNPPFTAAGITALDNTSYISAANWFLQMSKTDWKLREEILEHEIQHMFISYIFGLALS
jgi:hypothetical protein